MGGGTPAFPRAVTVGGTPKVPMPLGKSFRVLPLGQEGPGKRSKHLWVPKHTLP